MNPLWQHCCVIGQIFNVVIGQILKKYSSHLVTLPATGPLLGPIANQLRVDLLDFAEQFEAREDVVDQFVGVRVVAVRQEDPVLRPVL